jgi:cellobiose dehydrogenase (acceptor)
MLDNLLIMVWPNAGKFVVSPRYATDYVLPVPYSGPTITTLPTSYQNSTHWKWVFRCQNCTTWQGNLYFLLESLLKANSRVLGGSLNTAGTPVFAWAYGNTPVDTPSSPSSSFGEHSDCMWLALFERLLEMSNVVV